MKLPISPRLLACANFVGRGNRVADIGCDHGYLSIYLLTQGIARSVIAADVRPGPLESARRNALKYETADKMSFHLSDGVQNIPRDFDELVCAGMGADTIIHILEAAPWLRDAKYSLVLQCQSKTPMLRRYLSDSGWRIAEETVVRDGKFLYTVMEVWYQPDHARLTVGEAWFPPALLENPARELPEYYRRVVQELEIAAAHQDDPEKRQALRELIDLPKDPYCRFLLKKTAPQGKTKGAVMTTVKDILDFVHTLAPKSMAMDWDNVGLLCGSQNAPVTKVLVALDPFESVCREAAAWGAELIVTHHPLIFQPAKAITDETSIGRCIMALCASGISAVNAHTNLDCAPGGVNDILAGRLGLRATQIVAPEGTDPEGRPYGLLRCGFVDVQSIEEFLPKVKEALGCQGLRYVSAGRPVSKVAVGGGACAGNMLEAFHAGCDTFVTADVRYNQFWDAQDLGMNLIDAGHFQTENPVVAVLAEKIAAAFPDVTVNISQTHADCMKFY